MSDIKPWQPLEIVDDSYARCPLCKGLSHLGSPNHDSLKTTGACISCYVDDTQLQGRKDKPKHSHYHKDVSDYQTIDVYAVCKIFDVQDPSGCLQHAIKKLLVTGQRGHKDRKTDIQNAIDTLNRLLELEHG